MALDGLQAPEGVLLLGHAVEVKELNRAIRAAGCHPGALRVQSQSRHRLVVRRYGHLVRDGHSLLLSARQRYLVGLLGLGRDCGDICHGILIIGSLHDCDTSLRFRRTRFLGCSCPRSPDAGARHGRGVGHPRTELHTARPRFQKAASVGSSSAFVDLRAGHVALLGLLAEADGQEPPHSAELLWSFSHIHRHRVVVGIRGWRRGQSATRS
mmetsp:Transcript_14206/g.39095  ORF Transcript_14206/g.39095 Transcript_14206/m.39095 type:complete len:211 (-) Transcript_14206:291-923(-)